MVPTLKRQKQNGVEITEVSEGNLREYTDLLASQIGKLAWISQHCQDQGLQEILGDIEHEMLKVHGYLDYHIDEGILQEIKE